MRKMITGLVATVMAVAALSTMAPAAKANTNAKFAFSMFRNGSTNVYTAYGDGSYVQAVTYHAGYEGQPSMNRARTQVAFIADIHGPRSVYIAPIDSAANQTRRVVTPVSGVTYSNPTLSPDGTKIAFASNQGGSWNIWTVDAAYGTNLRKITTSGQNTEPAFSHDGTQLAFTTTQFTGAKEVAVMHPAGGSATRVSFGGGQEPSWSPSGARLAYAVKPDSTRRWEIHTQSVSSPNVPVIVAKTGSRDYTDPTWSPDGSRVIFTADGGYGGLQSASSNGGDIRACINNWGYWAGSANWGYASTYRTNFYGVE
jgi:TolB protein